LQQNQEGNRFSSLYNHQDTKWKLRNAACYGEWKETIVLTLT
jgi:hypothetical protein